MCAEQQGEYRRADRFYGECEELWEETRGVGARPDKLLLRVRMGVVNLLDERGHEREAEKLCGEVLKDQAEILGPTHQVPPLPTPRYCAVRSRGL